MISIRNDKHINVRINIRGIVIEQPMGSVIRGVTCS